MQEKFKTFCQRKETETILKQKTSFYVIEDMFFQISFFTIDLFEPLFPRSSTVKKNTVNSSYEIND